MQGFKVFLSCTILSWAVGSVHAQFENIWAFGRGNNTGAGLDFNAGNSPVPINSKVGGWGEASASVCGINGNLLFYTNGDVVWNRDHVIMSNGSGLTGLPLTASGDPPCSSAAQGTLIVPMPGSSSKYYIFSLSAGELGELRGRLYYSIVDMELNSGLGDVVVGSKGVLLDSMLNESMTAIPGNHCNIWLIVREYDQLNAGRKAFHSWQIASEGVAAVPVLSTSSNLNSSAVSSMCPSPDGTRILVANDFPPNGGLELFEFNPATGELSSSILLDADSWTSYYGAAFSPDGTKAYASSGGLYQFDLNSPNPADTKTKIGGAYGSAAVKLGPDNRIYTPSSMGEGSSLSMVMFPNLPGLSCSFFEHAINLLPGTVSWLGLPNLVPIIPRDTFLNSHQQSAGCFAVQTLITAIDTTNGWDYAWNTGALGSALIADTPGTYWVTYRTPPCNYHVDTFHVSFPNGVLPTIYTRAECRSDSNGYAYAYTYVGDPVGYSYTWLQGADTLSVTDTLSGVPSGSHSLHVQTDAGCDTLLFFDIPEEDFRVSFTVSDTLICVGDTIQLTNTSDAHFSSYHWAMDNRDTFVSPDPTPYVYPESGAYRLMLAGEGEICTDTAYQTILVDQPLLPAFEVEPQTVCVGQPVHFYPVTDSTTAQLVWEMEEQLRIESDLQPSYQHGFASTGMFPVRLKLESRACPDTSYTDSLRVYPYPEIDLGPDSSLCLNGQPIYLKNLREAPLNPYHHKWSTGDTTTVLKVVHPGIYSLSVTTEPIGCTSTESIEIKRDCYIDIPNAFTPDGDGHNDYFLPRQLLSENLSRFKMQVFNRWGQLLFETTNLNGRGWDGNFNGKAQPTGVYLYRIKADFKNGHQESYEGNVTLLR